MGNKVTHRHTVTDARRRYITIRIGLRTLRGITHLEILKPCAEWKLRGKLWKAWRERENRIGVKIEGALEICGISALAPPTMKWHQTI